MTPPTITLHLYPNGNVSIVNSETNDGIGYVMGVYITTNRGKNAGSRVLFHSSAKTQPDHVSDAAALVKAGFDIEYQD